MSDPVLTSKPILERFRLDGRVALVTGGGQGIGRAFSHALGEAGAAIAVVDISLPTAEEVAGELTRKGIDTIAVQADVSKADDIEKAITIVLQKWGHLTIGVNNAGIGQWIDAEEITSEDWNRMIGLNLTGVFLCAQIEDPVCFRESLRVTIEHGHNNHRSDDISSTAYWYQAEPHMPFDLLPVEQRIPRPDDPAAW
jgi:NAD(P)-dependent dehydrogenase (short-subunit alcohol dehydrogenase family)